MYTTTPRPAGYIFVLDIRILYTAKKRNVNYESELQVPFLSPVAYMYKSFPLKKILTKKLLMRIENFRLVDNVLSALEISLSW